MDQVTTCAKEVPALFEALMVGDTEALLVQQKKIAELESGADKIKNDLRQHLPRKLFMPVDRRDLLEILDLQDTIADVAEDLGDILIARKWVVPEEMKVPLREFVAKAVETSVAANEVMCHLDELVEVGFAGPDVDKALTKIREVLDLEEESDDLELTVTKYLFDHEEQLGAVSVILWLRIFELIGDLADYPKKVCNRLRLLVAS
jgi:predicted phosphate transport protein (TIGR00153 family)